MKSILISTSFSSLIQNVTMILPDSSQFLFYITVQSNFLEAVKRLIKLNCAFRLGWER